MCKKQAQAQGATDTWVARTRVPGHLFGLAAGIGGVPALGHLAPLLLLAVVVVPPLGAVPTLGAVPPLRAPILALPLPPLSRAIWGTRQQRMCCAQRSLCDPSPCA